MMDALLLDGTEDAEDRSQDALLMVIDVRIISL
jgi:hypothetical protein